MREPMASYTRDELALIRHYYQFYGPHWVMWRLLLPGRTPKQIASKASEMGVKCDPQVVQLHKRDGQLKVTSRRRPGVQRWTKDEDKRLMWALMELQEELGRSAESIIARAQDLAWEHNKRGCQWSRG